MSESLSVTALIVAAGRGQRAGGDLPKQYRAVAGRTLLAYALEALGSAPRVSRGVVVMHPGDAERYHAVLAGLSDEVSRKYLPPVCGAETRQGSVLAGLEAAAGIAPSPDVVLIHDAARPFVSLSLIDRAIDAAASHGAAVPGVTITDTIQEIDGDGRIVATPDRRRLRAVQTPQAFRFELILAAHRRAAAAGRLDYTDDGAVAAAAGHRVQIFDGEPENLKVTTPADFVRAEVQRGGALSDIRVAQGFDVHAFAEGDHVWLGGMGIPHGRRLSGHSDADVVLHAITDALLGAIGEGDIGVHFPPSESQWGGADSSVFLKDAVARVRRRGGAIAHLDVTIVCEAPKIGPYREAMRRRIAEIAGIAVDRVAVKATTSEGLGFTGRGEGMAAFATATVRLPESPLGGA
ncbi:MAG: bifunctional 2-C-methyl-D-erythritol 4-phosphate cytidylyltransferase/2-C-methyl-D-erythritol 2,4-cyclodiphosphate synthase [Methylobacteriaceae bacterium]|nr:bifunctional 2-C-methyl-D-erythritol 4-phosphate cytidylyltransferase/2-C-methyl-D-erythritol 2,4-cyclodiphosphate synthase [Methylobacteriaceae bacterium]